MLIGLFVLVNATNLVGVIQGNKAFAQTATPKTS